MSFRGNVNSVALVAELVDAADLKSATRKSVRVRFPPSAFLQGESMYVRKRDGSLQQWNSSKVRKAIMLAAFEAEQTTFDVSSVISCIEEKARDEMTVESVNLLVLDCLRLQGLSKVADTFAAYAEQRKRLREERLNSAHTQEALQDFVMASTYAMETPTGLESWAQIVYRWENMYIERFPALKNRIREVADMVMNRQILPAMRTLQFAGKGIPQHNARAYNCSFTHVDRVEVFDEAFYVLLCGCGVGYSVQFHHVAKLPMVVAVDPAKVVHYKVDDSIEGWAKALRALMESHFISGNYVEFDYSAIRPQGSRLSTSGGRAPGHLPLRNMLEMVRERLSAAAYRKLRSIECSDLMCIIAEAVLAGGVRRASLIALFSPDDSEMGYSKTPGNYDWKSLNRFRQMANISALCVRGETSRETVERLFQLAKDYGEPGIMWASNREIGCNPCGEIGMYPVDEYGRSGWQFCNLCEVNVAKCKTQNDLVRAATAAAFIGTLQAAWNEFPYLGLPTESIVRREALLGVGLTGMADSPAVAFDPESLQIAAKAAVLENQVVAEQIGVNPAARVTTVKPSGTASLVLGCVGSGIHPHHARRYFRRVVKPITSTAAKHFQSVNPHMVVERTNLMGSKELVLTFPVTAPDAAVTIKETDAVGFMNRIYSVYENWILPGTVRDRCALPDITHNVSCTVTVRDDKEWAEVFESFWQNRYRIGAMSFFPLMSDKLIPHMPREEVSTFEDEIKWNELIRNWKYVDYRKCGVDDRGAEAACGGGACQV